MVVAKNSRARMPQRVRPTEMGRATETALALTPASCQVIPTRLAVDTPSRGGKAVAHQRSAGSSVCQPFGGLVLDDGHLKAFLPVVARLSAPPRARARS